MTTNSKKALFSFLGILLLAAGTIFGVILVQSKVIFNEKAAEDSTTAEKIAEIAKDLGQNTSTNTTSYSSSEGYSLEFDKNYWLPNQETDLTNPSLQTLSFSLNKTAGVAKVDFNVFDTNSLQNRITREKSLGALKSADSLELLASSIAKENPPVAKERVRRNGRDFYKFTYSTKFLNQRVTYYTYITIGGDKYYQVTARYPSFGDGEELTESFIDTFSFTPQNPAVKGASATATPGSILDESKIVELTKPSVVEIAHLYCNDIKIGDTSGLKFLKNSYKFCDGSLGSGFVINKDGYVATNGHVAVQYPDSALIQGLLNSNPFSQAFFTDLVRELVMIQNGQEISEDQAKNLLTQAKSDPTYFEAFVTLLYKMIQQKIMVVAVGQEKYFIKFANDPITIDSNKVQSDFINAITPSSTIKEAKLVSFNYPNELSVEAVLNSKKEIGSDVAIIKVVDPSGLTFPSLTLGTSEGLKEGSEVIVIGYPGLVSGGAGSLVNQKSSATPTITKGVISAIKNDQGGLKLIQVDASIDHGNSGGPAFDIQGNVIGIATYGIGSQSGNYNFLRDIEDLKKLANDNSVEAKPSPTYIAWSEGLNFFWREQYKQAVIPFDKVEADYPIHPLAENYVNDSQTAIKKGQDKSDFFFLVTHDRGTQFTVLGTIVLLGVVGAGVFMFVKKKKGNPPTGIPVSLPPQNTPPVVPTNPPVTIPVQPQTVNSLLPQNPQTAQPTYSSPVEKPPYRSTI